jgi:hypothetical protein
MSGQADVRSACLMQNIPAMRPDHKENHDHGCTQEENLKIPA